MSNIPHTWILRKFTVLLTEEFSRWRSHQQEKVRLILDARLDLLSERHFGNHKRFDDLIELRWMNGMRVYSFIWNSAAIVVLNGGNKNGQDRDIKRAKKIREEILKGLRTFHE